MACNGVRLLGWEANCLRIVAVKGLTRIPLLTVRLPLLKHSSLGLVASALLLVSALSLVLPVYAYSSYGSAVELYQGSPAPVGIAVGRSGTIYWVNYNTGELLSLPEGSSSPTVLLSGLSHPAGVAVDSQGNLYYDQYFVYTVSELAAGSSTPTVLFNAGTYVTFMVLDPQGNLFVVTGPGCNGQTSTISSADSIVKWNRTTGSTSTIFSGMGLGEVYVTASEDVYYTTCSGTVDELPAGSSTPQVLVSGLSPSTGVAVDVSGDVIYTQYSSGVYELPSGSTTSITLATAGETHYGLTLDNSGDVFYTDNLGGGIWEIPLSQPSDFNQLVQAFDNLTAQYTALNQRYLRLVASFNQLNSSQQSLARSYAELASLYANQSKAYAELASTDANQTKSISTLSATFQSLSVALSQSFSGLSSNYNQLSTNYDQLSMNYNQLSNQLTQYQFFTYLLTAALVVVITVSLWLLRRRQTTS